jgi:hypothetical protein
MMADQRLLTERRHVHLGETFVFPLAIRLDI